MAFMSLLIYITKNCLEITVCSIQLSYKHLHAWTDLNRQPYAPENVF